MNVNKQKRDIIQSELSKDSSRLRTTGTRSNFIEQAITKRKTTAKEFLREAS